MIGLPLALFLTRSSKDTRSRASTTNEITLSFHPSTASVAKNTNISVDALMNSNNKPVNTIEFKVTYDKDLLELTTITNGTAFNDVLEQQPNNSIGTYRYAGISQQDVSGSSVKVVTLNFKTKTATANNNKAELGFIEILAGAAGTDSPIRYDTASNPGELTIEQDNACTTDTGRPIGCACDGDDVCESGGCEAGKCVVTQPNETCDSMADNKPDGCTCQDDSECASDVCGDDNKCALAPNPTATPTPSSTPIPTPTTGVIPTATSYPTPTIGANEKKLQISVDIPGINSAENPSPIHPQRKALIQVFNSANTKVKEVTHPLTIGTDFKYKATIGLGADLADGSYLARVKLSNMISKQSSAILPISGTGNGPVFLESLISGDVNQDNELSILDYNLLIDCSKNNVCQTTDEGQKTSDLNDDGKIDGKDLNLLYTGFASRKGE